MILCDAFAQGKNTVAAWLGVQVGLEEMTGFAIGNAGISSIVERGQDGTSDINLAALALGGLSYGVSPLELAAAYQMFGNEGQYSRPCAYHAVVDARNNEVLKAAGEARQVLGTDTAWVMRALLAQSLVDENGKSLAPKGMAAGGYFGRTSDDRSRTFVGMTPHYVSAVWWGTDDGMPLSDVAKGQAANVPLAIWQEVMEATPHTETSFEQVQGCVTMEFCAESGLLAGENCPETRTGYYFETHLPEDCGMHG
jgi:penicillin-binding protein 1A